MDINNSEELNVVNEDDPKKDFPQYLCKTCGKCCKSITTCHTHEELKKMSEEGNEEAKVFIDIFKPFASIEEAKKVVPEQIEQILSVLSEGGKLDLDKITFYYCPHITDEGKCSIYEIRPNCCRRAPGHGWSVMPPDCGFEGWQFEQREKQKKMVRSVKEYLYMVECFAKDGKVPGKDITIDEFRENILKKIQPWKRFGSMHW